MTVSQWIADQGPWAYIVGSYAVAAVVLLAEVALVRSRHRKALARAAMPLRAHDD